MSPRRPSYSSCGRFFRARIDIRNCGLDLTSGSGNRDIVDYLVGAGVAVEYEEGNTVD
jgi:hypothetical protein